MRASSSRGAEQPRSALFSRIAIVVGLLASIAGGQEPKQEQPKPGEGKRDETFPDLDKAGHVPVSPTKPAEKPAAAPQGPSTLLETTQESALRAYRGDVAPALGEPLPAGTLLLQLGAEASYGYHEVALPGGFPGYVHKTYLQVEGDGWGVTKDSRVSFRFRPQAGEPPTATLDKGTRLRLLALEGDWWRVLSCESVGGFVKADAVRPVGSVPSGEGEALARLTDASLKRRLEEQVAPRLLAWEKLRGDLAAQEKRQQELGGFDKELEAARDAYRREVGRGDPLKEELVPIIVSLEGLKARLAASEAGKEPVARRVDDLLADVKARRTYQEARVAVAEADQVMAEARERSAAQSAEEASTKRPLRRTYAAVGWLEFRPGANDFAPFRLTKGGRLLYYVTCTSGRYELQDFVDRDIGVRGPIDRPQGADVRVIDIERLVVLGQK